MWQNTFFCGGYKNVWDIFARGDIAIIANVHDCRDIVCGDKNMRGYNLHVRIYNVHVAKLYCAWE